MTSFGKVWRSIDEDEDFSALTLPAQHLYFRLIGSSSINHAGIVDWRPPRMIGRWRGATVEAIETAAKELWTARYIFIDEATEECLVRSHVRHDGVLKQKNIAVSMRRCYSNISSPSLRRIFLWELRRLHDADPDMQGWIKVTDLLSRNIVDPATDPSVDPAVYPGVDPQILESEPSVDPSVDPLATTDHRPQTSDLTRQDRAEADASAVPRSSKPAAEHVRFPEWYDLFGNKKKRPSAARAYAKAVKKVDPDELLKLTSAWLAHMARTEPTWPKYQPHPSTWLNDEQWSDEIATRTARGGAPGARTLPRASDLREPPPELEGDALRQWYADEDVRLRNLGAS